MPKCAVRKCKNNTLNSLKKHGKSYFRFPRDQLEREKWRRIIARERGDECFKANNSSVVCSDHFIESEMYTTKNGLRKVKKGALPRLGVDAIDPLIPAPQVQPEVVVKIESSAAPSEVVVVKRERESSPSSTEVSEHDHKGIFSTWGANPKDFPPPKIEIWEENAPPSPEPSEHSSIFDSVETSYYKNALRMYQEKIVTKSKQIKNLQRHVRRLSNRNRELKKMVQELKRQRREDKEVKEDLTKRLESYTTEIAYTVVKTE